MSNFPQFIKNNVKRYIYMICSACVLFKIKSSSSNSIAYTQPQKAFLLSSPRKYLFVTNV